MSKRQHNVFLFAGLLFAAAPCRAQVLALTNGDRISGDVRCDGDSAVVATPYAGEIRIARTSLANDLCKAGEKVEAADDEVTVQQSGKVRAGYESISGDTNARASSAGFEFSRETDDDETTADGETRYARDSAGVSTQQTQLKARYAHDIGVSPWYALTKIEALHDKRADINLRLMPQGGFGYYFWDTDRWKVSFENALAYEVTNYYRAANVDSTAYTQRFFALWMLDERFSLRDELDHVVPLADVDRRRIENLIAGNLAFDKRWSLDVRLISRYENAPVSGTSKYNARFVAALAYGF